MNYPINLDITMTATLRPTILRRTLKSFNRYAFGDKSKFACRLILNVDPIGENIDPIRIKKIAKQYIPNILCNIAKKPSFPKALIWCWSQVKTNYIFHLEDDWRLNRYVDIGALIYQMQLNKHLAAIRLNKTTITNDIDKKLTFNPSLFKKEFVIKFAQLMNPKKNPEKQINPNFPKLYNFCQKWNYEVFGKIGDNRLVTDIGRSWMKRQYYVKLNENDGKNSSSFTTWEKKC